MEQRNKAGGVVTVAKTLITQLYAVPKDAFNHIGKIGIHQLSFNIFPENHLSLSKKVPCNSTFQLSMLRSEQYWISVLIWFFFLLRFASWEKFLALFDLVHITLSASKPTTRPWHLTLKLNEFFVWEKKMHTHPKYERNLNFISFNNVKWRYHTT